MCVCVSGRRELRLGFGLLKERLDVELNEFLGSIIDIEQK